MRILAALLTLITLITTPAAAQEDDKGFIAGLLEDSLAGEGRTVQINGFRGALSKRATVSSIVILDDDGPWLRMDNLALQLNRSALLRGRVEVEELSAETIELSRLPIAPESELPPAEAQGFSLPDLPVSVDVQNLNADRIILGEPVLGEQAEFSLTAALSLIGGEARANLQADRVDGRRGTFNIAAAYQDDGQTVELNIDLDEGENGIAARLIDLPGTPSTRMTIAGSGSLNDLTTEISIATDGEERLGGTVQLTANAPAAEGATVSRAFRADVSGDVTALFAPQYRPFFGSNVALLVEGVRGAEGAIDISTLDLSTDALTLGGSVALNRDYWPNKLDIEGRIANAAGTPVVLPSGGAETTVREVGLDVQFDHDDGDAWTGTFEVSDFARDGIAIAQASLQANGTLQGQVNSIGAVAADVVLAVTGIALDNPDLQRAVGDQLTGGLKLNFVEGQPLQITEIDVAGSDYALTGDVEIADLSGGLETTFDTRLTADEIARFSGLARQDLSGAVEVDLQGSANLGGEFDVAIDGKTIGLKVGQTQADQLLQGQTDLVLKASRNTAGTKLETVTISNGQLSFAGSGLLTSDGADLKIEATLNDASLLADQLEGPATVVGTATQRNEQWTVDVDAAGPFGTSATIDGLVTGPDARVAFKAQVPDVAPFAPGIRGAAQLDGVAFASLDGWNVETTLAGPYGLNADVNGRVTGDGAPDIQFNATLPSIAPLVTNVSGAVALTGSVQQINPQRWDVSVDVDGPSGASAQVSGAVSPSGDLDLTVNGRTTLALANPFIAPRTISGDVRFDLTVRGPPDLSSVSGTIQTSNARVIAPSFQIALQNIVSNVSLSSGRADVDLSGQVSSGGSIRVSGPVGLTGSMPANLSVALNGVVIEDPSLYKTQVDGAIGIDGSLLSNARISGQIDIGETLVSVPSTGISSFGTIPNITHINIAPAAQRTRTKAGLTNSQSSEAGAVGPAYPLDITVNAPRRIFVRGRGLDAELGGSLRLTGTTANVVSSGRFELIRGRLDILSKRFELDEGVIQLLGNFDPYLRFVATTSTETGTASVVVDGLASDPQVRFESSPEAPEDEVLAQIFFGRDVSQISALQALQLASAVATLAGRGGEGIVSKLRRGFDLDDLDFTTDEDGNAAVRAGKYLSENIYADVTVGAESGPEVSLNIDITPSIVATGKLGSDGDTSIGIYFERDY